MKVLYLPLDERPCNYHYPYDIAEANNKIEIIRPDLELLGLKKKPANVRCIDEFLRKECNDEVVIVCSIDMIVYGGLIPSRIHESNLNELVDRLIILQELKKKYKKLKIYAFSSIMRTPSYSSGDEEPDYYEEYGEQIFKRKYYLNQLNRDGYNEEIKKKLKVIDIPTEIISNYEERRAKNLKVNMTVLEYVSRNIIDHLVIFQDDSAPYGYTAIDQKKVKDYISELDLVNKIDIYPGADEVGCSLLARAYCEFNDIENTFYIEYSSIKGPYITPLYEDRPMYETLKSHVAVTKGIISSSDSADIILMINSPGEKMQESWDQIKNRDRTYDSHRNLKAFVTKIKYHLRNNKKVVIADCAYANGSDLELIKLLDEDELLDKIYAYTGWNTHANTLGTVITAAQLTTVINKKVITNTINHIIESGFYQAKIRMNITDNYLAKMGVDYFDLKQKKIEIIRIEDEQIKYEFSKMKLAKKYEIFDLEIDHPWNRMFEIKVKSKLKELR